MHPVLLHTINIVAKILVFFILFFIYIKLVGPIPFSVNSVTTQKTDTFQVTGEGKVSVKPDIASVTVGISANGSDIKTVQEQINSTINKVSAAIKNLGVGDKDIETTNYSIYPNIDYSDKNQRINGYSASTNLNIKIRQIDKVNEVIDTATANGANTVGGVNFEVDDEPDGSQTLSTKTKAENEAREKAVGEAKKKAETAAKIAGFKLGRIINYYEGSNDYPTPMLYEATSFDMLKTGGGTTEVETGSSEITITVTLSYEIQ